MKNLLLSNFLKMLHLRNILLENVNYMYVLFRSEHFPNYGMCLSFYSMKPNLVGQGNKQ